MLLLIAAKPGKRLLRGPGVSFRRNVGLLRDERTRTGTSGVRQLLPLPAPPESRLSEPPSKLAPPSPAALSPLRPPPLTGRVETAEALPPACMRQEPATEPAAQAAERRLVFLSGSDPIEQGPPEAKARRSPEEGYRFVVGDAPGADAWFMRVLHEIGAKVYRIGRKPGVPIPGRRWRRQRVRPRNRCTYHATKNEAMAGIADMGICAWDGRSRVSNDNLTRLGDVNINRNEILLDQYFMNVPYEMRTCNTDKGGDGKSEKESR